MDSKALALSVLLLYFGAALCLDVHQQELTWRAALAHIDARSARFDDNEEPDVDVGSGSATTPHPDVGSGSPTIPRPTTQPPTVRPSERFAPGPYLSLPQCQTFGSQISLPAQPLEELQWRAMCELTCISKWVSVVLFSDLPLTLS